MEGPRAAKVSELPLVERLSNEVFRTYDDDGQTMFQEFPDLFCEENIDNVRVIFEDGKPVSNMNYVIRPVSIYGCSINAASLGAVATLKDYRGHGYASSLLDDCVSRMYNDGVDVLIISGDRRLYRNIGSTQAGLMYMYQIKDNDISKIDFNEYNIRELNIKECSQDDLYNLANLYKQENVRFVRYYDKFYELLDSRKFMRKKTAQKKVVVVESKEGLEAYFYMVVEGNEGTLYDCAGSRELIIKACKILLEKYDLKSINGRLMTYHTSAINYCRENNIPLEERRLIGTIKIVNFKSLMESLRQYFYEIYDNKFINELEFENDEKGACFKFREEKCIISDKEKLNDLIFGGAKVTGEDFVSNSDSTSNYEVFAEFFERCLPIPFIDPLSLNYI
ncbi:MAG TPA: GNAT family N-acetyltransferase [Clostridiales bacterium]|nr:GNAT family N-acetyltransferase [Clostridiales bacterium]